MPVIDAGSYSLAASALTNYMASDWSCVLSGTDTQIDVSSADAIALALTQDVTCSIVYTYAPPATSGPSNPTDSPTALLLRADLDWPSPDRASPLLCSPQQSGCSPSAG